MCQYHVSSPLKRRALLRVGPIFSSQDVHMEGSHTDTKVVIHINQSFPMYWDLPCREPVVVSVDIENTKLGKQLTNLMNNTIYPFGMFFTYFLFSEFVRYLDSF